MNTQRLRTSSSLTATSVVCINQIPMLNMFDLRRRTHNQKKVRDGEVDDLESALVPDNQVTEQDLELIEKEVNKKKRKRRKDQKNGDMLSPMSMIRSSQELRAEQANVARDQREQEELLQANEMMVDQIFQNPDD